MTKWEYTFDSMDSEMLSTAYLNSMGGQGWDLVAVIDKGNGYPSVFFKRPLEPVTTSPSEGREQ